MLRAREKKNIQKKNIHKKRIHSLERMRKKSSNKIVKKKAMYIEYK